MWWMARAAAQTVATDAPTYATGDVALASWADIPAGFETFVALAVVGWPDDVYSYWAATPFKADGEATFDHLPAGILEVRVYEDYDLGVVARSAPFTVEADGVPSISALPSPTIDATVTEVAWTAAPGFFFDWVGVTHAGDPPETYLGFQYTCGDWDGTLAFADLVWDGPAIALVPGDYDVCLYANGGYEAVACALLVVDEEIGTTIPPSTTTPGPPDPCTAGGTVSEPTTPTDEPVDDVDADDGGEALAKSGNDPCGCSVPPGRSTPFLAAATVLAVALRRRGRRRTA
jgi:hypothetical protein